ncbi:MAG: LapA family protein [Dokdonella sp.]|uniref:LapA family protein n=1 Tax=Dokdonella sp. TaxID=2291710 RepID=UPI0025BED282|nr:LapA family protein [Dokdonella sp.]MBX3701577.1 LapA family protein [Dokdonella sp.]MCW5577679.1 LapA family protein [Dokdonella sp.]
MRLIALLVLLLVIGAGAVFGALNSSPVTIDFGFAHWQGALGVALLVALALGWLLGGALAWCGQRFGRERARPAIEAAERQP